MTTFLWTCSISSRNTSPTRCQDEAIAREPAGAIERAGLEPSLGVSGGGSDANTFNEKGIRCVNLAIEMTDIHTVHESIAMADLRKTAAVAVALMTGA